MPLHRGRGLASLSSILSSHSGGSLSGLLNWLQRHRTVHLRPRLFECRAYIISSLKVHILVPFFFIFNVQYTNLRIMFPASDNLGARLADPFFAGPARQARSLSCKVASCANKRDFHRLFCVCPRPYGFNYLGRQQL